MRPAAKPCVLSDRPDEIGFSSSILSKPISKVLYQDESSFRFFILTKSVFRSFVPKQIGFQVLYPPKNRFVGPLSPNKSVCRSFIPKQIGLQVLYPQTCLVRVATQKSKITRNWSFFLPADPQKLTKSANVILKVFYDLFLDRHSCQFRHCQPVPGRCAHQKPLIGG